MNDLNDRTSTMRAIMKTDGRLKITPLVPLLITVALLAAVSACSKQEDNTPPATQPEGQINVSIVSYMEREAGVDPYPVRIVVSDDFVRLDDGYDASDFVLLDRTTRTLYSVTHENRSVLIIENQPSDATLPDTITLTEEQITDAEAPQIGGKQPVHVRYMANDTTCFEAVSVDGLMTDSVAGMQEFAIALGNRQRANMHTVPETMQTPCFLSRYVYTPGRLFAQGLPVQWWDESGFYRSLTDFVDSEQVAPNLFYVPDDYQALSL
jgi:hypothetical protein